MHVREHCSYRTGSWYIFLAGHRLFSVDVESFGRAVCRRFCRLLKCRKRTDYYECIKNTRYIQ
jgi:hypothetical protein